MILHGKKFINKDMVLKKGDRITIDIPLTPRPQERRKEQYYGYTITVAFPVSGSTRGDVVCMTNHLIGSDFINWSWQDIGAWEPLITKVPDLKTKTLPEL